MSRSARDWLATLTGGAAAGFWSLQESQHGIARTALAIAAGACASFTLWALTRREP